MFVVDDLNLISNVIILYVEYLFLSGVYFLNKWVEFKSDLNYFSYAIMTRVGRKILRNRLN